MDECENRSSLDARLHHFQYLNKWASRLQKEGFTETGSFSNAQHRPTLHLRKTFTSPSRLARHSRSMHKEEQMKRTSFSRLCPVTECPEIFNSEQQIRTHLSKIHSVQATNYMELKFPDIKAFNLWQKDIEDAVGVWYKKINTYTRKSGLKVVNLKCQSGESRKDVLRDKFDRYCPSIIILHINGEGEPLVVKYYATHYGHYSRNAIAAVEQHCQAPEPAQTHSLQSFPSIVINSPVQSSPVEQSSASDSPASLASPLNFSSGFVNSAHNTSIVPVSIEQLNSTVETALDLSVDRTVQRSCVESPNVQSVSSTSHLYEETDKNVLDIVRRRDETLLYPDKVKLAVSRNEMNLVDAMELIRIYCSSNDDNYYKTYEANHGACEKLRDTHLMWCEKQKVNTRGQGDETFALLASIRQLHDNPLIFEEILEEDDFENQENYMIIVLNSVQVKMLQEFGDCGIVCVDLILDGKSGGVFNMMSVNVIDAIGEPLPCALCISDRSNLSVARQFFSVIKSKTGVINSRIFICDHEEYHNQWASVMNESKHVFLASWLVDDEWRNVITSYNYPPEEQLTLYFVLRGLMKVSSAAHFETKLETVIKDVLPKFHLHSDRFLLRKAKLWASCYRHLEVQNCDSKLEALHQELIGFRFPKDPNGAKSLDCLLLSVLDVIRAKCCERLTRIEPCLTNRLEQIEISHNDSFHCTVLEIEPVVPNIRWMVKTKEGTHFVWKSPYSSCESLCKLSCAKCDTCIHRLMCTCFDNLVLYNICVHIHIVSRHMKENADEVDVESTHDCQQCLNEKIALENLRADIIARCSKLQQDLNTIRDIDTLTVVSASLVALQDMIDKAVEC